MEPVRVSNNLKKLLHRHTMTGYAVFDENNKNRFKLERYWNGELPKWLFILHNPAEADAKENDNTISRLTKLVIEWGGGSFCVCNLFAIVSNDPQIVHQETEASKIMNKKIVLKEIKTAEKVVYGWGAKKNYPLG